MSKKDNIPLGVRQEFDDIDYWHKLDNKKPVHQLPDGTWLTQYEYLKKFMHESYGNNFDRDDKDSNILQTPEQKKWAQRNNNNTNRDALNVIKKAGKWITLFQIEDKEYTGSLNEEWEQSFKEQSYEQTFQELIKFSADEIGIDFEKHHPREAMRMYFRIKRFLKLVRKDQKNKVKRCKQCTILKPKTEYYAHGQTKDKLMNKCKQCCQERK